MVMLPDIEGAAGAVVEVRNVTRSYSGDVALNAVTATFAPGRTTENIVLTIIDDAFSEAAETLVVTIAAGANATLGAPVVATVTIFDNDASGPPPTGTLRTVNIPAGAAFAVAGW